MKNKILSFSKKNGFMLVEILIVSAIMSVIILVTLKILDISIISANLSNSLVTDVDLKGAIQNTLKPSQCEINLHSSRVDSNNEIDSMMYNGVELYKVDENFKEFLKIVKIELSGTGTDREFAVYYKRNRLKHLETKKRKPCDSSDQSGCYVNKCNIELEYDVNNLDVKTCQILDCFAIVKNQVLPNYLSSIPDCFSGENKNLIMDCQTATNRIMDPSATENVFLGYKSGVDSSIESHGNVFLGWSAGIDSNIQNQGDANTFVGFRSGMRATVSGEGNVFSGPESGYSSTVSGRRNMFIGESAGINSNVEGSKNVFIGARVGTNQTVSEDYIVNIGDAIIMKSKGGITGNLDPTAHEFNGNEHEIRMNGELKICDANGASGSCQKALKESDVTALRNELNTLRQKIETICSTNSITCPP